MPIKQEREAVRYYRTKLSYRNSSDSVVDLSSVNSPLEEYWTLLLYYANVREEGMKLLKTNDKDIKEKAFLAFSAFIKQAKNYYDSTRGLHHRVASLNYYYCFLNLAKAAIIVNHPRFYDLSFNHGLSSRDSNHKNLLDRVSKVSSGKADVFTILYRIFFGVSLVKGDQLRLGDLLEYCSEATYQMYLANNKLSNQLPCYYCVRYNQTANGSPLECWPLIAIKGYQLLDSNKVLKKSILSKFERVEVKPAIAKEIFGIYAREHNMLAYYQSRYLISATEGAPLDEARQQVKQAIGNYMQPIYYDDPYDFLLCLPFRQEPGKGRGMNESIAIFAIMHHLSELVRYRPDYLEGMLSSKDAWVLESVIDTSPEMFIRGIVPLITHLDYRILRR